MIELAHESQMQMSVSNIVRAHLPVRMCSCVCVCVHCMYERANAHMCVHASG